jgi:hypothetical protein
LYFFFAGGEHLFGEHMFGVQVFAEQVFGGPGAALLDL